MTTIKNLSLSRRKQKGVTLIEALLVIGIAAIAIVSALTLFGGANAETKLGEATKSISFIKSNVEQRYRAESTSESGLDNVIAVQGGLIPKTLKSKNDGTIVNEFGGNVVIAVQGTDGYYIEYAKVPKVVCSKLITQFKDKFSSTVVGGTTIQPNGTQTAITQACSAAEETVVRFVVDQI